MSITQFQLQQVNELLQQAERYYKHLQVIEQALAELLEVESDGNGYYGHISDAIMSGALDSDRLIQKLSITVEPDQE